MTNCWVPDSADASTRLKLTMVSRRLSSPACDGDGNAISESNAASNRRDATNRARAPMRRANVVMPVSEPWASRGPQRTSALRTFTNPSRPSLAGTRYRCQQAWRRAVRTPARVRRGMSSLARPLPPPSGGSGVMAVLREALKPLDAKRMWTSTGWTIPLARAPSGGNARRGGRGNRRRRMRRAAGTSDEPPARGTMPVGSAEERGRLRNDGDDEKASRRQNGEDGWPAAILTARCPRLGNRSYLADAESGSVARRGLLRARKCGDFADRDKDRFACLFTSETRPAISSVPSSLKMRV